MDITFDPTTQYLEFKQIYLDKMDIICIYQGSLTPTYTIDPSNTPQDLREYYWNLGLTHIFDVISLTQSGI